MSVFVRELSEAQPAPSERTWVFVAPDQLNDRIGLLASESPKRLGIVMVESAWKASQRPYHKQKLALVLSNMRHFAVEQARRGVAIEYLTGDAPYVEMLTPVLQQLGPACMMEAAEREMRAHMAPLVERGLLQVVPHEGWLTSSSDFEALGKPPWRMDTFYRRVRQRTGILMEAGKPVGGKYSFDAENRKAWRGEPPAPEPLRFRPTAITKEVGELVETRFGHHPGVLRLDAIPATKRDAARQWRWARDQCLTHFGPYEDAMSVRSTGLFHTRISALLNLCRLLPRDVLADVLEAQLPLASREGFVRQLLGWREFVRHVHRATDGFRRIDGRSVPTSDAPGDGGWAGFHDQAWLAAKPKAAGGARPSRLGSRAEVPPAWWGARSNLACLDRVVAEVWNEGYGHHITRLMILSNLASCCSTEGEKRLARGFLIDSVSQ